MLPRVLRPDSSQISGSSHGPFVVSACICMVIISGKSKDQPTKIVNPARGQLNRKKLLDSSIFCIYVLATFHIRDCLSPRSSK